MPRWHPLIFLLPLNFDTSGLISLLVAIQYLPHGVPIWMSITERAPLVPGAPNRNDNRGRGRTQLGCVRIPPAEEELTCAEEELTCSIRRVLTRIAS
jgi:hypothetical protein